MVLADIDDNTHTGVLVLRPNQSWTWRANLYFLATLGCCSLFIATGFLLAGAWLVLPFTLVEMTVLGLCIHYCVKRCSLQEVITVSDYQVKIERGIRKPAEQQTYHRLWAKFFVSAPRHPWEPPQLCIASKGVSTEIGAFLNRQDKQTLVQHLKRIVSGATPSP